jgi:hypothetical protein
LNTQNGLPSSWPGDGTAYRIQVSGPGMRAGFEAAIADLKGKLHRLDTLLINTNNHGDWDSTAFECPATAHVAAFSFFGGAPTGGVGARKPWAPLAELGACRRLYRYSVL